MNTGKYIFAQLIEFLPQRIFDRIVMKYEGNKYVKHFTCWNQLLVMMFGQLSNRDSLRDLTSTISAHSNKVYHLGFGKNVTRSNLAKVNERREPHIFEEFAYHMIDIARKKRIDKDFEIDGKVFAFDSTTIDLCLSVFWWAKFRRGSRGRFSASRVWRCNPLITSHSPCTTAEDGRCQSLAITVFSHHIFCKDSDFP